MLIEPTAVERARKDAGLTQRELADRLGTSLWDVERLESGLDPPKVAPRRLSEALDTPLDFLRAPSAEADPASERKGLVNTRVRRIAQSLQRSTQAIPAAPLESRLVLGALATIILVRFFTEIVVVFPRAANFIDIPIFFGLALLAVRRSRSRGSHGSPFALPAALFLAVCVVAAVANTSRVHPAPVLVFVYGFLAPLGVYAAVHRLWTPGHAANCTRFIAALGVIQLLVVGIIDLPKFLSSGNPDVISGTFGENAYQLVFFLLVFAAMASASFTFERQRLLGRLAPLIIAAVLITILLAQYRALLATTALTLIVVGALLGAVRMRGLVLIALLGCTFYMAFSFATSAFPGLKIDATVSDASDSPGLYFQKRWEALSTVGELYADSPTTMLTGSGPGTFSSRAWATFGLQDNSASRATGVSSYTLRLTGGELYHTDVSDKYILPRYRDAEVVSGSRAISTPLSSYTALLAEVGVIGFALLIAIYVMAMAQITRMTLRTIPRARSGAPLPALLLGTFVAFFVLLQMAILENWLEVTRVTFIAWALLAIATREFNARFATKT